MSIIKNIGLENSVIIENIVHTDNIRPIVNTSIIRKKTLMEKVSDPIGISVVSFIFAIMSVFVSLSDVITNETNYYILFTGIVLFAVSVICGFKGINDNKAFY